MATTVLDSPGSAAAGGTPSIAQLIAGSSGAVENEGATSLDDLRDELRTSASDPEVPPPVRRVHRRRRNHEPTGKPRGRPRKDGTAPAPAPSSQQESTPGADLLNSKITRAELAAKLAALELRVQQADAELLTERARHDSETVGELDNLVQMVAIFAYGQVAEVRGPHWALSEGEAEKIGKPAAKALAPYAARLNVNIPWVAAVLAIADVTWGKVRIDQKLVRELPP